VKGGIHLTQHLPSNDRRDTYIDNRLMGVIMKYAVEMGSGAMICIPSFIKIGSDVQKLIGGIHRHTDSMEIA
jgi:hypothetical protein